MLRKVKIKFFLLSIICCQALIAAVDPVVFDDSKMQARYQEVTQVLRCPKCQNQSIAGSDAPIAQDMRRKVVVLMKGGKSNAEIEQYMIDRYGDFVTYDPPLGSRTYILWFAPPIFLVFIVISFMLAFRKPKVRKVIGADAPTDDQSKLKEI